ncbi:hypothetical protein [Sphaerisporangium sp. NPDC051011]|uniref:hypothetical protein n=1 Tax=Sphaerisporangium sp. NPDC051011 TaxID=3155792 RepID=UPI00340AA628
MMSTTQYTESDLRAVLDEYSGEGPRQPVHLEEIVRRGRGARLRRRVTAGAALAGAVAAVVGVAGLHGLDGGAPPPGPASSARVTNGVDLPDSVDTRIGGRMALIHFETHTSVGTGVKVTFQPTSLNTGFSIRCADPQVWVLVRDLGAPGGSAALGRCGQGDGGGVDSQYDWQSAHPGWLRTPQSLEIWVFPADAPIVSKARPGDGAFDMEMVTTAPERLASMVGHRPSAWAVGVYDKPAATPAG